MRIRWRQPGPDLFDAAHSKGRARIEQQRDALARERVLRGKGGARQQFDINRQRLEEIVALITHRHGGPADTDESDIYFRAALPHILASAGGPGSPLYAVQAAAWSRAWTPSLPEAEAHALTRDVERDALKRRRSFLRADALAVLLRLTRSERAILGITTIGAVDWSKRQRTLDRKKADKAYQAAKRAAAGARPHSTSKSRMQPWKKAGMSRAKWYRLQARETVSSATPTTRNGEDETVSSTPDRRSTRTFEDVSRSDDRRSERAAIQASPRHTVGAGVPPHGAKPIHVEAGRSVEPRHSGKGWDDARDFIGDLEPALEVLGEYAGEGGIMPGSVVRATREAKRLRHLTQEQVARQIGISRPTLANAMQGRFGLSRGAAASLSEWLRA